MFRNISLTIQTETLSEVLTYVEKTWYDLYPENLSEYFFLDTDFDRQYRAEEQVGKLFGTFTFLGIIIACLGLFGLASFTAEQRTKEIGVRKVIGASVSNIVMLLSRDFVKLVALSALIAWPVSYFAMHKWLQNFAYRTTIELWLFVTAGFVVVLIALFSVSYQAIKAALINLVEALRYE